MQSLQDNLVRADGASDEAQRKVLAVRAMVAAATLLEADQPVSVRHMAEIMSVTPDKVLEILDDPQYHLLWEGEARKLVTLSLSKSIGVMTKLLDNESPSIKLRAAKALQAFYLNMAPAEQQHDMRQSRSTLERMIAGVRRPRVEVTFLAESYEPEPDPVP